MALIMSDDELERLFGELCAGARGSGSTQRAPADVYLIDEPPTLVLELAVPGLDLQSLRVSLEENRLSVEGRRGREPGPPRAYQHGEIDWGPFRRVLSIGRPVDGSRAWMEYGQGLLRIHLPLAERRSSGSVVLTVRVAQDQR